MWRMWRIGLGLGVWSFVRDLGFRELALTQSRVTILTQSLMMMYWFFDSRFKTRRVTCELAAT